MRARASLLAAAALLVTAGGAAADPSDVYVDFARDGKLDCTHSQGDLEGILTDASLNEYGDPLTLTRLRIAVRRGLAAGCVGGAQPQAASAGTAAPGGQAAPGGSGTTAEAAGAQEAAGSAATGETAAATPTETPLPSAPTHSATSTSDTGVEATVETVAVVPAASDDGDGGSATPLLDVAGGLGLAALALALGGWLARRTLSRSP
jgi:hypothetical protein